MAVYQYVRDRSSTGAASAHAVRFDEAVGYWRRYWWRARHVLTTQGLRMLLAKIRRWLRTTLTWAGGCAWPPEPPMPYGALLVGRAVELRSAGIVPVHS
jgi:hypothetical protein